MSNCLNHKKEVAGISDMKLLAEMIGDLHYETLGKLLHNIENKILIDYQRDEKAGRTELAICLWDASIDIGCAALFIDKAWQISKPFMTNNIPNPEVSDTTKE